MSKAVEKGEFEPYLQFVVDRAGTVVGAEAVSRWQNPEEGLLKPSKYIDLMIRAGTITELDLYMLRCACVQLQTWKREGRGTLWLSCNFTRQSIADEKILARVREIVEQYDFTRDCLVVELTEDSYAHDREAALQTIEGLHAMGLRIVLDDIGAGYSSLSDLSTYPIDGVKIDRSIVIESALPRTRALLEGMIRLSHDMRTRQRATPCLRRAATSFRAFISRASCPGAKRNPSCAAWRRATGGKDKGEMNMVNKKRVGMMVAVTLLTGVLLFCSVFFLVRRANREITQRSFDELATATRQIAKDLVDAANADQTILSAMAELIAGHDERDNDAVLRIMKSLSETFVSTVALLRPDGTLLLTDGTRYDVSDTFDFETEAARGAYISDRVTSYFAPEKLVVRNVVPVVRDGETVAILYGVVLLQELSRNYQIDLYNGNAFLLLVDGNNGDILLDTWHDSLGNISELRGRKMLKGYTYEEAMEKIPNGIGGDMCTVSQSTGMTLYLHYEPVGINNWSVVLGVSEAEALAGTRDVVQTLSMMAIIVTALLLSYLGFMVWYLASARRGVYRMSITDQGTGLMNRVAYEKCLRKSDQRVIAPAACIYIDANGLHEINNERGHEAGDQLLRAVAERLREQFPRDDLYRVGGDEFVVFPAPAAEAEYEARMRAVSESLAAQGHSISYGIAVCEAANGLRELVREADEKMLESKRAYYAEHDRRRLR